MPKSAIGFLGLGLSGTHYELIAFDGTPCVAEAVRACLVLLGKTYKGEADLTDLVE